MVLVLFGGIMLFCYGVVLNQAPFDFGRLIGEYVATFGTELPVAAGGLLIIAGSAVTTLRDRPA